ncbi:glycine zipper 2TM domain-containing protein [Asticcacaulis sp. EMRT-3]|uniref:glycine zipper 2TM domain-containing protein n=1 Tax=Asticcacaulis sp. EMRT-3 TaxID=3040349 RepID=UPI0024AFC232|nr:glycine zipper 2TM domain-containing protein [Asticcacaulis sp. EMRT-3]MDI7775101.1 glycine zipper 2TM domain-containing protein [Asticcacaulis sp. EMRT-3]
MSSKLILMAATAALALGAPLAAHAQYSTQAYDGYCYARKSDAKTNGAVLGAVVGGLAGSQVSKHERGLGAIGGAVLGGVVGSQIGKSSVKCYNGAYYSYSGRYYTPPAAPDGYEVLYFKDRPTTGYYDHVYNSAPTAPSGGYGDHSQPYNSQPYNDNSDYQNRNNNSQYDNNGRYGDQRPGQRQEGFQDARGQWHYGAPRAFGWQDDNGVWHTGNITYGWRDSRGTWHVENNNQNTGYSPNN